MGVRVQMKKYFYVDKKGMCSALSHATIPKRKVQGRRKSISAKSVMTTEIISSRTSGILNSIRKKKGKKRFRSRPIPSLSGISPFSEKSSGSFIYMNA